jgi:hypothetical protein
MNDWNSVTAGTKSRRTLRKVRTNDHNKRAVINIVPIRASEAAFFKCHGRNMNGGSVVPNFGFCRGNGTTFTLVPDSASLFIKVGRNVSPWQPQKCKRCGGELSAHSLLLLQFDAGEYFKHFFF